MPETNDDKDRPTTLHHVPQPVEFQKIPINKARFDGDVTEQDKLVVWSGNTRLAEIDPEEFEEGDLPETKNVGDEESPEIVPTFAKRVIEDETEEGQDQEDDDEETDRPVEVIFPGGFPNGEPFKILRVETREGGNVDLDIEPGWEGVDRSDDDVVDHTDGASGEVNPEMADHEPDSSDGYGGD